VNRGERVGLIGPNGSGKTTLLRIITGLEAPDSGYTSLSEGETLGYLPQGLESIVDQTVSEYLWSGLSALAASRQQVEHLAASMRGDALPDFLEEYGQALARFEELGGYTVDHRIETILAGLGLGSVALQTRLAHLSGGQRTRLGLARLLLQAPTTLVLDEPTNHLDIGALEWLEQFLKRYAGSAIAVSHDAMFLDRSVSRILELDGRTHHLAEYAGNYSAYVQAKARELDGQWAAWQDQQDEIARLEGSAAHLRDLAKFRRGGKADSGDKFAKAFFANRSRKTVRRAKRIETRIDHLMTDEHVDKPQQEWRMRLEFGEPLRSGQMVVALEDLGHTFGERWLFRHAKLALRYGERIALVGSNGSGKTTLLRLLAGELAPTEGSVRLGANVRMGYMPQEQENLDPAGMPLQLVRQLAPMDETKARHFLHFFLFEGDDVFTPIDQLSYGERARLILATLVLAGANCLLLDEPINHLDIASRERFEVSLDAFPGAVLLAVHDRALIDRFATGIWSPVDGTLRPFVDRDDFTHATMPSK
jgi:ATP-binding cassette subfamily F protein 3